MSRIAFIIMSEICLSGVELLFCCVYLWINVFFFVELTEPLPRSIHRNPSTLPTLTHIAVIK